MSCYKPRTEAMFQYRCVVGETKTILRSGTADRVVFKSLRSISYSLYYII